MLASILLLLYLNMILNRIYQPFCICYHNQKRLFRINFKNSNFAIKKDFSSSKNHLNKDFGDISKNFIVNQVLEDIKNNKYGGRVRTRFPPEPNGFLHLGHAKSINLNFQLAKAFNGETNLRFDDTNPSKEDIKYFDSIASDVNWLVTGNINGPTPWKGNIRYTSDYFPIIVNAAEYLIEKNLAYVDDLSADEIQNFRGDLTTPGKDSPFRNRSREENMELFSKMKSGAFKEGERVLRAKIDMKSPNMNMRDPILFRIKSDHHPIQGNKWHIYPMYDFAHAISDAVESITHSLCTLEFEGHRPLYDWTVDNLLDSGILPCQTEEDRPYQYEFSRLNLQYTVLSKRKLIQLVNEKVVSGWDDPRMPTICGLRRRGFTNEIINLFCDRVGISKSESNIDIALLEDTAREVLDPAVQRLYAIEDPLRISITNWQYDQEYIDILIDNHPKNSSLGKRVVKFSPQLFIDRNDYFDAGSDQSQVPPKGYKRLLLGGRVRLKNAFNIRCIEEVRDQLTGKIVELKCELEQNPTEAPASFPSTNQSRPKGVLQWVSEKHSVKVKLNLYDRLFLHPSPGKDHPDGNFLLDLNPHSLVEKNSFCENSILDAKKGQIFQLERIGYFVLDSKPSPSYESNECFELNRIVTLKNTWENKYHTESNNTSSTNRVDKIDAYKFSDLDLRVGLIESIEIHPNASELYILRVNCGDEVGNKQIVASLRTSEIEKLKLKNKLIVICNLKPSKIRGILSEGMVLSVPPSNYNDPDPITPQSGKFSNQLIVPGVQSKAGAKVFAGGFTRGESRSVVIKNPKVLKKLISRIAIEHEDNSIYYESSQNKLMVDTCYLQILD